MENKQNKDETKMSTIKDKLRFLCKMITGKDIKTLGGTNNAG